MIKVTIKKENGVITNIKMTGHAKYDEYGKDIVCAGVSSALITTVNACLSFSESSVNYKYEPFILENIKKDKITNTLLENLYNILKGIEKEYKDNIKVEEE